MTYAQIAEWVAINFDISTYGDPKELWLDVGKRFNQDGMYLPPEAEQYVNELWQNQVGVKQQEPEPILGSSLDDYISVTPSKEQVQITAPPTQPVIEQQPKQPPPIREGVFSFRNIGKSLRSAFRKIFKL